MDYMPAMPKIKPLKINKIIFWHAVSIMLTKQTNHSNNKTPHQMKNLLNSIAIAAVIFGCSSSAFAQASATSSASANVITPISIVKTADMNFGNAAVSASTAGTVVLAPAGTRTATGGVTLPVTAGTVSAAAFTVSGAASYTYSITIPGSSVNLTYSGHTLVASAFTSSPSATGTLSASGTQTLTVGATLAVTAGAIAGTYTNATAVPVTVNYN